jgi:hypothetical protein
MKKYKIIRVGTSGLFVSGLPTNFPKTTPEKMKSMDKDLRSAWIAR